MKNEKDLMEMPLHKHYFEKDLSILRVAKGWIYTVYGVAGISSCFVPEPIEETVITCDEQKVLIPNCPSEFTCMFPDCRCFHPAAVISNQNVIAKIHDEEKNGLP
jgi:hypothetical protein